MSVESEFEYEKMQIANMVKRLRAYASLSQRDLSNLTGISQADISKIERGLGNPSINTIARIMNATGASLDFDYNRVNKRATEQIEIWPNLSSHIKLVANNSSNLLVNELGDEIERIILFGSCARGENTDESDIDIAAIVRCERTELNKYSDIFAQIGADMMSKYQELVNIVGIPLNEFLEKKSWYPFYNNIDEEGLILYAR